MNRLEIIKDYIKFCNDCKLKTDKKTSKLKYINTYIKNYVEINGLQNFESVKKEVTNILKYNPLTIDKLSKGV